MGAIGGSLYFHSPCFDGIASAVLAVDFLSGEWGQVALHPVDYRTGRNWLTQSLPPRSAVVDFLFHPDAYFWADHHATTFGSDEARRALESHPPTIAIFDERAPSCAGLLWRVLSERFDHRTSRYAPLVEWAEKIDSARYDSVEEAIFAPTPALRINLALAAASAEMPERLIRFLATGTLDEAARLPEIANEVERALTAIEQGVARFRAAARLEHDGIVVFVVDGSDVIVPRYAPYLLYPDARYSIGVVRNRDGAKITAMRNPWREFESIHLGRIFAAFGGGGHQRVGSVQLPGAAHAMGALENLLTSMRQSEPKRASGG